MLGENTKNQDIRPLSSHSSKFVPSALRSQEVCESVVDIDDEKVKKF